MLGQSIYFQCFSMSDVFTYNTFYCLMSVKDKRKRPHLRQWKSNYFSIEKHPLQYIYYTYVTDSLSAGPLSCGGNTVLLLKPPINFPRGSENVSRQWKYDQDVEIYTLSETHLETIPLWHAWYAFESPCVKCTLANEWVSTW